MTNDFNPNKIANAIIDGALTRMGRGEAHRNRILASHLGRLLTKAIDLAHDQLSAGMCYADWRCYDAQTFWTWATPRLAGDASKDRSCFLAGFPAGASIAAVLDRLAE